MKSITSNPKTGNGLAQALKLGKFIQLYKVKWDFIPTI